MNIDPKLMQAVRSAAHLAALVLVLVGCAEWAGFRTPVPGDWWQIMIGAASLKQAV